MLKITLATVALALATGGARAETGPTTSWSDSHTLSAFETMPASVAVATDKASGRKFNVIKLPNGKMMVLISAEKVQAFSPFSDDSEMMFSGHTGTTR